MDKFGNIVDKGRGTLLKSEIDELNKLGFIWDASRGDWDNQFEKLQAYFKKNNHSYVLQAEDPSLYQWCYKYRKRENQITAEERKKFDSVNFIFGFIKKNKTKKKALEKLLNPKGNNHKKRWHQMFEFLKAFKEKNSHFKVPKTTNEEKQLSLWVNTQRVTHKKGKLSPERVDKLNSIHFPWNLPKGRARTKPKRDLSQKVSHDERWGLMFEKLKEFKDKHKHFFIPINEKYHPLSQWVITQRIAKRKEKISDYRTSKLNSIGFSWDYEKMSNYVGVKRAPQPDQEIKWLKMFDLLFSFVIKNGHTSIPRSSKENDQLGRWLIDQRKAYRKGTLSQERIEKFKRINVDIAYEKKADFNNIWFKRYDQLKDFFLRFGNSDVPSTWKENATLAQWVLIQRMERKKNLMSEERVKLLQELNFSWSGEKKSEGFKPKDDLWMERLGQLKEYKIKFGHCNVPQQDKLYKQLGRWVNDQRGDYKKEEIEQWRMEKLNELGFIWNAMELKNETAFNDRFNELIAFHEIYGNYKVPQNCKEFPKLGGWVSQIRHRGTTPERKERLDKIGFNWKIIKKNVIPK